MLDSVISAGGLSAPVVAEGLAERDISMGEDLGLSTTPSMRRPSTGIGGVALLSDSLDGLELSVVIRSRVISRKTSPQSPELSTERFLPLLVRELRLSGLGSVKVFVRGELMRSPSHQFVWVGRRLRRVSGAASSFDPEEPARVESSMGIEDELVERAKSEREVERDGLAGDIWGDAGPNAKLDEGSVGIRGGPLAMLAIAGRCLDVVEDEDEGRGREGCRAGRGRDGIE